jgi:pseudouridine-5'-phosphate glycosidase
VSNLPEFVEIAPEVRDALERRRPIVAMETTILSHGMPYPQNVQTAREVEKIVRDAGGVPATIAVIAGRLRVGLRDDELERFGTAKDVMKLSRADLPYAIAQKRDGATTVAATMECAALAGIAVFATGGIGGVHRGVETSFDVSADLEEFSRSRVAVVCAGAKALLDGPKTLEVLETHGAPVIGYRTDTFPAFWSRESSLPIPLRLDDAAAIADFIKTQAALGAPGGTLICNPIPAAAEIPNDEMSAFVERALAEASAARITGKAVTPWLLDRIYHLTNGRSLTANIALVKNNVTLAAAIAKELAA